MVHESQVKAMKWEKRVAYEPLHSTGT